MTAKPDLYEVLGVGRDADTASIRRAYRARAKDAQDRSSFFSWGG